MQDASHRRKKIDRRVGTKFMWGSSQLLSHTGLEMTELWVYTHTTTAGTAHNPRPSTLQFCLIRRPEGTPWIDPLNMCVAIRHIITHHASRPTFRDREDGYSIPEQADNV